LSKFGVLFDLDGTLVNTLLDIVGSINAVRENHSLPTLSLETIRSHIGKGAQHLVRHCFADYPEVTVDELVAAYRNDYYENPVRGGSLYPGVRETLEALRAKGARIGVATNKPSLLADVTLAHYLPGFKFDVVAGPERVSRHKPHPAHLTELLPKLDLAATEAWFVGDDPVDAQCAEAAGVHFLGAGYGFGRVEVSPLKRLDSFSDLLQKIPHCAI